MYVLLRMPFKVYPLPCFIIFLPECCCRDHFYPFSPWLLNYNFNSLECTIITDAAVQYGKQTGVLMTATRCKYSIDCHVPARRGLQQTAWAATRHGARDPLVRPQVDQTYWGASNQQLWLNAYIKM